MITVSLCGVKFQAVVGLYPQEKFLSTTIEMNMAVSQIAEINDLPLIDYTILHAIAKNAVSEPTELLETIVQRIVVAIKSAYETKKISVAIRKLNPPMSGEVDYSEVKWEE